MKTRILTILLLNAILLASCGKKDDGQTQPAADVYVRAKIDGKDFSIGAVPGPGSTTGSYAVFSKDENKLFIYGTGPTVNLVMTVANFPKKTGTHALGDSGSNTGGGTYIDAADPKNPTIYLTQNGRTGTITINGFDGKTISGTFSYNTYSNQAKKEVKVTGGEFNVPYTEI